MVSRKNAKQKNVAEPSFGSSALLHGLALAMHRVLFVGRSSTWWSTRDPCRILSFKTCDSDEIGSGWGLGATFSSEAKLFLFLVLTITSAATATSRNNSSMWHVYLSIYGFCFGMVADSYQHGYQLHGFC